MKNWKKVMVGLAAVLITCSTCVAIAADGSQTSRPDRMAWWREARFGMFIHWGIYSVPARGEWYMNNSHVPLAKYEAYAGQFNPEKFNAKKWVSLAKEAGMKYLVITSKHHDGFCMFNTKATDYNVVSATPWKHDPLKDVSEECRKQGIKFCVYYSIMDWHHPDQMPARDDPQNPTYNDNRMRPGRKEHYIQYMKTQMQEMMDQYHPSVIWFDGQWGAEWSAPDGSELYQWLRKQDPNLIISDRVGGAGDFGTPEQNIPATGLPGDWETCMTMSKTWGYDATDKDYQPAPTLLRNVIDIASKGGNYLLNVGPTAEGIIPEQQAERLETIGRWMKVNGEAIYGTTASPFKRLAWGRCSKKISADGTTLYLMVFEWPADGRLIVPGLRNQVKSAATLANAERLKATVGEDELSISVPAKAPDATCSVIKVEIEGKLDIGPELTRQRDDGTLLLETATAKLNGSRVYVENKHPKGNIGNWFNPQESVEWLARIVKPGTYMISAEVAMAKNSAIILCIGEQKIEAKVPNTGDYSKFQNVELGTITIGSAGIVTVKICPVAEGWIPINLATVTLTPKK